MSENEDLVLREVADGVCTLTLNRPAMTFPPLNNNFRIPGDMGY